jgi:hypothetical protein
MIPGGLCSLFYRGSISTTGGLTVVASPAALYGSPGQTIIGPAIAIAIGGTGPYSYLWAQINGDQTIIPATPALASTNFSCGTLNPGDSKTALFTCTITDSASNVAVTNQIITNFTQST